MSHHRFDPGAVALMDRYYPGWEARGRAMVKRVETWISLGVCPKYLPIGQHALLYEEVYLALTNATPNKPPLAVAKES